MDWWNELTELQQFFASVAIPATVVMVIQFILLLFGFTHGDGADSGDAHGELNLHDGSGHGVFEGHSQEGFDTNAHGGLDAHSNDGHAPQGGEGHDNADALRLFTLRSIIAFLSVGGWMGVAAISWKLPVAIAFVMAFAAGFLALYFVAWSIRAALKLQQSGNVMPENAIGKTGEVYIPIPASKGGFGKVSIIIQDRLCELEAITDAERILRTGESVTVTSVGPDGVLVVGPRNNPQEGEILNYHTGGQ